MLRLKQHFKPFSLLPGELYQIPGSRLFAQVFPSLIRIFNEKNHLLSEVPIDTDGSLKCFSVMQDLHRGGLTLFSGSNRYAVSGIGKVLKSRSQPVTKLDSRFLSFGIHKKQDWQMIYRRRDVKEILPLWFRMGLITPGSDADESDRVGIPDFLEECFDYRRTDDYCSDRMLFMIEQLFSFGFGNCLVPQRYDRFHRGIFKEFQDITEMPLTILCRGASLIESLIYSRKDNRIEFLKKLPGKFVCGKLFGVVHEGFLSFDLEWTKKRIGMIRLKGLSDTEAFFSFPLDIKQFRLRKEKTRDKGRILKAGEPIAINSGITYLLDCFEK
ncbi:MAG: hypothetical protein RSB82_02100 [Victivallaceae bacterium]